MWEIIFGVIGLVGLLIVALWLIGLPAEGEEEELAGFVTANWDEIKRRIGDR
jgi:ABC-type transporter Mla subunit MlaD